MRRVVVSGMGIVSSIGNNTQEVLASLREARSGVSLRRTATRSSASAARCTARRSSTRPTMLDRRAMRFHGGGTAWNHIAMDQAIQDSGLETDEVSNERTGIIMGSGGPSTRAIVEAADMTRDEGSREARRSVRRAEGDVARRHSATLATWFKIKGVNYSISSACATSNHCIGNA